MKKIFIHAGGEGHEQNIIMVKAANSREGLHLAADRYIKCLKKDNPKSKFGKREQDWTGYPWPSIVIYEKFPEGHAELSIFTFCEFWKEISD